VTDKIEYIQEKDVLNTGRDKINKFAIAPALRAESNSLESKVAAQKANEKSSEVAQKQEQLEQKVESLVIESGTSDAEVVLSRPSEVFQRNFDSLPQRLEYTDGLLSVSNGELKSIQKAGIYEPASVPNTWTTDPSGRVLNISSSDFFELFYNKYVGTNEVGISVEKNYLGLDESGTYQITEFSFVPPHPKEKLLLTSGMHTYELPASFGLAHFIKDLMDPTVHNQIVDYIRENVILKVIPIINPWGWNQNPKKYGNINGVNLNRNFDSNGRWEKFPSMPPSENEWNYKGIAPFSEAETKILRDWALTNNDALYWIDCHTGLNNDYGENWIHPSSKYPKLPEILDTLKTLEERIKHVYQVEPRSRVRIDTEENLRRWWSEEVAGVYSMTIEQSSVGLPWGTNINNEGDDIREYEIYINSYVGVALGLSTTKSFVDDTTRRLETAEEVATLGINQIQASEISYQNSMPTIFEDTFDRVDGALGAEWLNEDNQLEIFSNQVRLKRDAFEGRAFKQIESTDVLIEASLKFGKYVGLILRQNVQNGQSIHVRLSDNGLRIYEESNRQSTAILSDIDCKLAVGRVYKMRVIAVANVVTVYIDDNLIAKAQTSIVSGGQFGIRIATSDYESTVNSFKIVKLLRNDKTVFKVNYSDWSGSVTFRSSEDGTVMVSGELTVGTVPVNITRIVELPTRLLPSVPATAASYNLTTSEALYGLYVGASTAASLQVRNPLLSKISKGDKLNFNFAYGI
jgi:murein tripeptide amidase MpaA